MPDPLLYSQAMGAAAIVSAISVLVTGLRRGSTAWRSACSVPGVGLGLAAGYSVLSLNLGWPPRNGLDRLLFIVVPAALIIELIAAVQHVPRWVAWLLRIGLAAAIPRILLHASVYLSGSDDWPLWNAVTLMAVSGGLLVIVWSLLAWLNRRSPGVSIPLSLCLSTQCAGATVMLAGYIKGGAAALPLVASLAATAVGLRLLTGRSGRPDRFQEPAILGIGIVGLFGILFIGRYFGRLSTTDAVTMLFAPLLCWVSELPWLRDRKPWLVGSFRIALVTIPLLIILAAAKREFDQKMSPLLTRITPAEFAQSAMGSHAERSVPFGQPDS